MPDQSLPEPLVPADCDLRDMDGFMLNVERLLSSELWAISTGDEFKAAMALWARAWKQMPASSLPNDDRVLAAFAGVAPARWKKLRPIATRGFVLCSDGRLYHRVLAEDARRAWERKESFRDRGRRGNEKRWRGGGDGHDAAGMDPRGPAPQGPRGGDAIHSASDRASPGDGAAIAHGSHSDPKAILNDRQGQGQGQGQGQEEGPGRAREGSPVDRAVDVIRAFDRIRVAVFGANRARLAPWAKDRPTAERWLDAGADLALCEAVFEARFRQQLVSGAEPSDSLAHCDRSIADALVERRRPMPEGRPGFGASSRPDEFAAALQRIRAQETAA